MTYIKLLTISIWNNSTHS